MKTKSSMLTITMALGLTLVLVGLLQTGGPLAAATAVAAPRYQGGTIPTTIVLTPTKDNTLYESVSGNVSNGAGSFFFVGKTSGRSTRRGLVTFALADKLPADATVVSATLQLQMSKTSGGAAAIGLHRALADWGEGTSDASSNEGSGATATPGDATWLHTFYDTALWQTAGGDFVPTATATITVGGIGVYVWPTSPAMVAEVQQWLDNPDSDFGWVLIGDEATSQTTKRFTARESGAAANRPQLTVVYTIPGTARTDLVLSYIANNEHPVAPGEIVTYTLALTNQGTIAATNVGITVTMPSEINQITVTQSFTGEPNRQESRLAWSMPALTPGAQLLVTLTGVVDPAVTIEGARTSTAVISATNDLTATNNVVTASFTVNIPPQLTITGTPTATAGITQTFALGTLSDTAGDGPWQITIDWGDGSSASLFTVNSIGPLPAQAHRYQVTGSYTATVTIHDRNGNSKTSQFTVTVKEAEMPPSTHERYLPIIQR